VTVNIVKIILKHNRMHGMKFVEGRAHAYLRVGLLQDLLEEAEENHGQYQLGRLVSRLEFKPEMLHRCLLAVEAHLHVTEP
jgi:hypothetical protein